MGTLSSNGGLTTVTSPATAKNCITVGASRSNGRSDDFQDKYAVYTMVVSQAGTGGAQEVESYRVVLHPPAQLLLWVRVVWIQMYFLHAI